MSSIRLHSTQLRQQPENPVWPIFIGLWAAAIAFAPSLSWKAALVTPVAASGILFWVFYRPSRWLYLLFFTLLALPPLPLPGGGVGLHIAPLAAGVGLLVGAVHWRFWRNVTGQLPVVFALFVFTLLISSVFALVYSGATIALGSFVRILLFALSFYVFLYTVATHPAVGPDPIRFTRFLFVLVVFGASFGCVDFYFQLPAPAGYGPQFVWLDQAVMRRAQGLFYEASTLGNFCVFFLILVIVCLFRRNRECPIAKPKLLLSGVVFAGAIILSYSRASILNFIAAMCALAWTRREEIRHRSNRIKGTTIWRGALGVAGLVICTIVAVRIALPSFAATYWSRIVATVQYASSSPNGVLSGRLTSWQFLGDFLWRKPWTGIFGIGYKTLPYSDYTGAPIVADNTYLQLLVETGIFGFSAFLIFNWQILRTGLRASKSSPPVRRLFGEWIFCFWVGQMVQMLSGDLITYWRVLPVYFWVLAVAARE